MTVVSTMLYISILVLLARLVTGVFDENLHAKYQTMPRADFIEYFNKQNYSWKITDYGNDVTIAYGGRINFNTVKTVLPVQKHDSRTFKNLPAKFDSREKWPQCETIKEVYEQGNCDSSWAFATANTASDRTCIHKNIHVDLSVEDLECLKEEVCNGVDPEPAFTFWLFNGLVTKNCKPYNITKLKQNVCSKECVNKETNYTQDKHYADNVYLMSNDSIDQIKAELFKNGPLQALFNAYADFSDYKGGIYEHKYGAFVSYHCVRVIGYGIENDENYWLVTNSWGKIWGEDGLFRVKAFGEKLFFESYIMGGIPSS